VNIRRSVLILCVTQTFVVASAYSADFEVLHAIKRTEGYLPWEGLVAIGSTLYGISDLGGPDDVGMIFSIDANGSNYKAIHTFSQNGNTRTFGKFGGLTVFGSELYGTVWAGPSDGAGTIFSVNSDESSFQNNYTFDVATYSLIAWGIHPSTLSTDGVKLYGTTLTNPYFTSPSDIGGGTVYSINPDGSSFHVIHTFDNFQNYDVTLLDGRLYGIDGNNIFSMYVDGSDYRLTPLHGISRSIELMSTGSRIFGTSSPTSDSNNGTIFSMNPDGSDFQILHLFQDTEGGTTGSLVLVGTTLYGETSTGGEYGLGTSVNQDGSNYQIVHSFNTNDGVGPSGELVLIGSNVYGAALSGGEFGFGTIYSFTVPEVNTTVLIGLVGGCVAFYSALRRFRSRSSTTRYDRT